jgi:uncharacterized membrane protein
MDDRVDSWTTERGNTQHTTLPAPRPRGRRALRNPPDSADVPVPHRAATGTDPAQPADGFVPGRLIRRRTDLPGQPAQRQGTIHPQLAACVLVIVLVHLVALVGLWPRGPAPTAADVTPVYAGVAFIQGSVRQVTSTPCAGTTDTRAPDGSIPAVTTCVSAIVELTTGPHTGSRVTVGVPIGVAHSGLAPGSAVELARYPAVQGGSSTYAFLDYARDAPMGLLVLAFAALIVLVARWRGLLALAGLGLAFAAIAVFVLPALRHDENPILVAGIGAGSIMIVILYLAHGVSIKTTTALLGTLAGIWVTAGLAAWATAAVHLDGLSSEDNLTLSRLTTNTGLDNLILAGIVLAGLGVLNDVTITQASAVWELRQHAPHLTTRGLFSSGMRIGRDHLASTIYTIAFAYAGVALPTLLLADLYGEPLHEMINSGQMAEEITRTLVASIGLILAIPLTTAIAALLAARAAPPTATDNHSHGHGHGR